MATKKDPGPFDCYGALKDDEPYFLLKSTDPIAPALIQIWRAIRAGNMAQAEAYVRIAQLAWYNSKKKDQPLDSPKSKEADVCAAMMVAWKMHNF